MSTWVQPRHPQSTPRDPQRPTHNVKEALAGIDGVQQLIDVVLAARGQGALSLLSPPGLKCQCCPPKPHSAPHHVPQLTLNSRTSRKEW